MSFYYPQAAVKLSILPEDFQLTSDASKQKTYPINIMVRDVTVVRNDYKTTDTVTLEIDYKNFPFDPRTIRACGITVYMENMSRLYTDSGKENKLQPGAVNEDMRSAINFQTTNAVFAGFADEDQITLDDSKRTVRLEGRDFTALLIDQKYQVNAPIPLNQPINVILTNLLAAFAATQQILVINKTGMEVLPTLAQYYPDFGSPLAGQRNTGQHESYWEIIQDIVNRAGLICFISIDKLIITTPKNQTTATADDIKFIYGQNVKSLMFKRKLGRFKNFNIQVRSRAGKDVLIAKIPEEATEVWAKAFGIERKQATIPVLKPDGTLDATAIRPAPYISFPVPNISNKDQLINIGQTIYEQYSLQQLEGTLETFEMIGRGQTYDKDSQPRNFTTLYDLTQIQKGQSIVLEIASDDLNKISRLATKEERIDYLIRRNYDETVASIFASTMGKFSPRFFIKSYTMRLNQDTGFSLKIDFINIVDLKNVGL